MESLERPPITEAELRRRIQELIDLKGGGENPDLVTDIIENALKMLKDVPDRGDARVMSIAIRELRLAYKLFTPYAEKRKVTMFGSARTLPTKAEYQQATDFARKIAAAGWMVTSVLWLGLYSQTRFSSMLSSAISMTSSAWATRRAAWIDL